MSIVSSILNAIFDHPSIADARAQGGGAVPVSPLSNDGRVDIDAVMDKLAAERGERLDWKNSVVDLLKTVGLDSSLEARKRLAQELHYQGEFRGTAVANEWLHDQVLKQIEDNGGKLPEDLR